MSNSILLFLEYIVPVVILFYMAVEVYVRNPRISEYRIASAIVFTFMLMLAGEYIRQIVPIKYSPILVTYWLGNIGALNACLGFHFHFKILNASKKITAWLYIPISYSLIVPSLLELIQQKNIYNSRLFERDGMFIYPIFNAPYYIAIGVGVFVICLFTGMLAIAYSASQSEKEKKRTTLLLYGTIATLISQILFGYIKFTQLPPYPYLFTDVIWLFFLRWAMIQYDFLPSASKRFETLFELNPVAIVVADEYGYVMEMNPAAKLLLGGDCKTIYDFCSEESKELLSKLYTEHFNSRKMLKECEMKFYNKEDDLFIGVVEADYVEMDASYATILIIRDETEQRKNRSKLEYLAFHDALTGLPNRRLFTKKLQEAIEKSQNKYNIAVLYVDGDDFKRINDTMGHETGDQFLKLFAERLQQCLGPFDLLARLGGDEFIFLLNNVHHEEYVESFALKIIEKLKKPFVLSSREFLVSGSIGISINNEERMDAETMICYSDIAMYEAKKSGRNTYRMFNHTMLREVLPSQLPIDTSFSFEN
ncbi:diguanylate cyclase [Fodinisporobacter ferrooxydans]|uniref:Diguanylate cyclase n=1 Tax=Fodinisporobacter ferrooxydans TaxID=2901836 RepID=A0ABY4CPM4_9BACL|nr:diguanylate cyclase [Alicyclobacillaceae bacterium MYW30-H2]